MYSFAWFIKKQQNKHYLLSSELTRPSLVHTAAAVLVFQHDSLGVAVRLFFAAVFYRQPGNVQPGLSLRLHFFRFVYIELTTTLDGRHTAVHRWSSQYT